MLINRDILAGLFLIMVGAVAFYAAAPLPAGSLSGIGSGLLPKSMAVLLAAFGVGLVLLGIVKGGEPMSAWSLRGMIFILGAVVVFGATVRPLGVAVAVPLAVVLASLADSDTRPLEIAVFAVAMTVAAILLFKVMLRLPIPLLPPVLGY